MVILLCLSLFYFRPPFTGVISMLFWGYLTDTCNNRLGTSCFTVWTSIDTLIQSLTIGNWTTYGLCKTQLYGDCFTQALIFLCSRHLSIIYNEALPVLIDLCFVLTAPNMQTEVFCFTYNSAKNWLSDFLTLGLFRVTNITTAIGLLSMSP